MLKVFVYSALGVILLASSAPAQQSVTDARAASGHDLGKVEGMKGFVGSEAARKLLTRNGFVVTGQQFKQIFAAYIGGALPKFITTDSAWHTYYVLLEEGVMQLEEDQAKRLREFSRKLVAAAEKRAKAGKPGFDDLADFASVGLALQDASFRKTLPKEQAGIVGALTSGSGLVTVPVGFPLMAERFRAKSFYTKSSALADYFAARQWYAVVDFRLRNDRETALAVKLAMLIHGNPELSGLWGQLSEPYDALLAKAEDGTVRVYAAAAIEVLGKGASVSGVEKVVPAIRKLLAARLSDPKVNDQLLTPAQYADFKTEIKGFRLLPPRRLPSAVCFQNTVDPKITGRMFPSGLDFLVACKTLRSPAAKRALEGRAGKGVAAAVARADSGRLPESLHGEALKLLAVLQKPAPKQAPTPLRTRAWADKQLWTQLGAWAEQRHTWALHTKLTIHYLGMAREPAGMVSPYPEFFEGLGRLSQATARVLDKVGVGKSFDAQAAAKDLLAHIKIYRRLRQAMKKGGLRSAHQRKQLQADAAKVDRLFTFLLEYTSQLGTAIRDEPGAEVVLKKVEKLAGKCATSGKVSKDDTTVLKLFARSSGEVSVLLGEFAALCDRLARIARRQLAGKDLAEEDEGVIKGYGVALAKFHFYGGNSWLTPRDDFPIITPIFISPPGNKSEILYAGLARPHALYVIAKAGGKLRLFRGAVMSYREFRRSMHQPLDDESWKALVKAGPVPPPSVFTRSFLAGMTAREVIEILRSGKTYSDIDNVAGRDITKAMIGLIDKGKHPRTSWLIEHLCRRCTDEDAGDLVALMAKVPKDGGFAELALTLAEMPWKPHRARLMKMLHDRIPKRADAAAYILSRKPGDIDAAELVKRFDKQTVRTKRLYCFLFGCVPKAGEGVKKALLGALRHPDDGLRWQAADAIARGGLKDRDIIAALVRLIEDTNEFVASAAVRALADLKADKAAPAMLARLKKGVRPRNITSSVSHRQTEAITGATRYGGSVALMVLRQRLGIAAGLPSLGEALVEALGVLGHKPATKQLEAMFAGNYAPEAIEALRAIDPKHHVDRLVTLALNKKADILGREEALEKLREVRSTGVATRLLPLLEETTAFSGSYNDKQWRVCDQAAQTIASLLDWKDNLSKFSEIQERKKLIAKIRQWAKRVERK